MIGYRYSGRALAPRRRGGRRWKGVFMDKNEILEKSRKENQLHDEGVLHAQEKGRQWGVLGFLALCVAVQVYHLVLGLDNSLPMVFFLGYVACEALGRYRARREKHLLVVSCLGALGVLAAGISYVMETLPILRG